MQTKKRKSYKKKYNKIRKTKKIKFFGGNRENLIYPAQAPPPPTQGIFLNSRKTGGGIYTPNGLWGSSWTPHQMSGNHYSLNTYKTDPVTAMLDVGANRPYLFLGGKKTQKINKKKKKKKNKRKTFKKKQYNNFGSNFGGGFENSLAQDLANGGRQLLSGATSIYNGLSGYPQQPSVMPYVQPSLSKSQI